MFRFKSSFKAKRFKEIIKYLANFLKTNPTKFAVICVKKRHKARFLSPRSSKIKVTKEKEKRKGRTRRRKGGEEKKRNGCTLSFYKSYIGDGIIWQIGRILCKQLIQRNEQHWCQMAWNAVCHKQMAHFHRLAESLGNI